MDSSVFKGLNMGMGRVVLLLSDFGTEDTYAAELQLAVLSMDKAANVVHVTHQIPAFDVRRAAMLVEQTARIAPVGSILLAAVDPDQDCRLIAWQSNRHLFLGADNGVFDRVGDDWVQGVEVTCHEEQTSSGGGPFRSRDVLAPIAGRLARGESLLDCGLEIPRPNWPSPTRTPLEVNHRRRVEVISVDHFGNAVLDLRTDQIVADRVRVTTVGGLQFDGLSDRIAGRAGERLVLAGSSGYVELCEVHGNAARHAGLQAGDQVDVMGMCAPG